MNCQDKISVIMGTYNEKELWLRQSIESILTQSYTNFEFIVALDNPDNHQLRNIVKEYAKKDNRIVVLEYPKNLGRVASLNLMLEHCTGDYIAVMDADDKATKNRFKIQLNYIKTHNLDIVGSYVQYIDEKGNIIQSIKKAPYQSNKVKNQLLVADCMPHPTWLVKKEVYKHLKGYKDIIPGVDYAFLLRASQNGYKLGNVPKVLVAYRMTSNSISRKNLLKQYLISLYLQKHINEINLLTNKDIENYLNINLTPIASSNYDKGYQFYLLSRNALSHKHYLSFLYYFIKANIQSKWITHQIVTIILGSIKVKLSI